MEYPKPVMKKKELIDLGFTKSFLDKAFHSKGQTFAWKSSNSSRYDVLFDTAGLEKYRLSKCGLGR